jgi:cytoskeleton protein RodZ
MSTVMKKLREDLNRDVKEIAATTRIKESFLKAIENEQYDKLPIEVYARGYIKVYARYLGMSFDMALEPYERYLEAKKGSKEKKLPASPEDETGSIVHEEQIDFLGETEYSQKPKVVAEPVETEKEKNESAVRWYYSPRYIWKGVLLVIVLCVVVYQLIGSGGSHKGIAKPVPPAKKDMMQKKDEQSPAPQKSDAVAASAEASSRTNQAEIAKATDNQAAVRKRHVLVLTATEKVWIQVILDGKEKKEALMAPGDSLTYEALRSISGIIGNAGGVKVKYNGRLLPNGKIGEVLYLNLPEQTNPQGQSASGPPPVKNDKPAQTTTPRQL